MSMMEEIEKFLCHAEISINYRLVNLGGKMLYIEGIKNIIFLGETEMQFQLKKQAIKVQGSELIVKYLDKCTCVVSGNIVQTQVS